VSARNRGEGAAGGVSAEGGAGAVGVAGLHAPGQHRAAPATPARLKPCRRTRAAPESGAREVKGRLFLGRTSQSSRHLTYLIL